MPATALLGPATSLLAVWMHCWTEIAHDCEMQKHTADTFCLIWEVKVTQQEFGHFKHHPYN